MGKCNGGEKTEQTEEKSSSPTTSWQSSTAQSSTPVPGKNMTLEKDKNKIHYNYRPIEAALDDWSNTMNSPEVTRAVRKLKFMVLAYAWVDFCIWHKDNDNAKTMSWAWEDMVVALSGYGQSALTGTVIDLWTATPRDRWDDLRRCLNAGIALAEDTTSSIVPRRYLKKYQCLAVRSPDDGFDLPSIVPAWGPRLREWASKMGMDPDAAEEQMRIIEEYERLGLIELSGELRVANAGGGADTIVPGPERIDTPPAEEALPDNVYTFSPPTKGKKK